MAAPEGRLAENIVYFARALRAAGMQVGPGAVLDALEALSVERVGMRDDFYWTLHAVFVKRHEHTILFDQAFRIFFRKRGYIEKLIASMIPQTLEPAAKSPAPGAQRIQEALFSGLNERAQDQSEIEVDARLSEVMRGASADALIATPSAARAARPFSRGAPPHTPARSLAGAPKPRSAPSQRAPARVTRLLTSVF